MRIFSPIIILIATLAAPFIGLAASLPAGNARGLSARGLSHARQSSQLQPPQGSQQEKSTPAKSTQDPSPQNQDAPIHLSSRLVLVPVSASDEAGNPVKDLTAADIVIEEDGRPQPVVALGEPGKTALDIALLFDVSGSTQKKFDFEQKAAVEFIKEELKPTDSISLFAIGVTPKMMLARTTERDQIIAAVMSLTPSNEPTAFFDAIVQAAQYLDRGADSGTRRVIVVISDGEENYSKSSKLADALKALQRNDCVFYSINPTGPGMRLNNISMRGEADMESMASQTGGKAYDPAKIEELDSVFRQIAEELKAQYLFGYYAPEDRPDGGFRKITVKAPKRPDLRIRARQGYYASKP